MILRNSVMHIFLVVLVAGLLVYGCDRGPTSKDKDDEVVAQINNFTLTVEDFKGEADFALGRTHLFTDATTMKDGLLENIIVKKILLQEAQKQNFDKDAVFMKEIERYWEQALLKLLLSEKEKEVSGGIVVEDKEARDMYDTMKKIVFAKLTVLNTKSAAETLSRATNPEEAIKEMQDSVISERRAEWWSSGDLPLPLEEALFSLKPGQTSSPIPFEGNWVVITALREESVPLEPYAKLKQEIIEIIKRKKIEASLEEWIAHLRKRASVKINKDVLEKID